MTDISAEHAVRYGGISQGCGQITWNFNGQHAAYLVAGSAGLAVIDPPALKTNGAPLTDEKNDMTVGMRPAAGIIILPFIQHAVQPYS